MDEPISSFLTDPLTVAVSLAAALGHALGVTWIQAFVAVLWANVSTLFTALSITGWSLAPRVAWLPEGPLTAAALVAGGAYVLKLIDRVYDQMENRL
ncbi:hypothetical protein ACOZ4L_02710 [Haloplanus ruber]|uniref:Uncharacterized protein n=1 Tax=Haloplanus ruber TaxID=869892 RepID=A0ABD6D2R5_9EURY|nr:hypothetical protein [Haloplanus ruber]